MLLYLYKPNFCLVQQQGQELSSVRRTFQTKGSMHPHQPLAQRGKSTVTPSIGQLEIWARQWNTYLRKYARSWHDSISILHNKKFHVWIIPSATSASFKLSLCLGNNIILLKSETGSWVHLNVSKVLPAVLRKGCACQRDLHLPRGMQMCRYFGAGGTWAYLPNSPLNTGTAAPAWTLWTQSDHCFSGSCKATTERDWEVLAERGNSRKGDQRTWAGPLPRHTQTGASIFKIREEKKLKIKFSALDRADYAAE